MEDGLDGPVQVTLEQLGVTAGDEFAGQLDYDLCHLSAYDPAPVDAARFTGEDACGACLDVARAITQSLVAKLFALPSEPIKGGRLAQLPPPVTILPREKPAPKAKALTKWQKFAQQKGIVKRKRSKLEFDEAAGEWKRRHGYKRANNDNDVPVLEAKATDKVGEDPFTQLAAERKERINKQKKQQLDNVKLALKQGAALPTTLKLAAALPEAGSGNSKRKRRELKAEIKEASRQAGISTASIGKFDKRLKGEKDNERNPLGKRRKFMPVTDTTTERSKMAGLADKFLRERADDILDVRKAISKLEAETREARHALKLADGPAEGGRGGKKGAKRGGGGGKGKGGRSADGPSGGRGKQKSGKGMSGPKGVSKGPKGASNKGGRGGRGGKGGNGRS